MATYFSQSWVSLLLILFFGYLATTNLVLSESPGSLTASTRFKVSVATVHYGPWLCIILLAITPLLSTFDYVTAAIVLSVAAVPLLLLLFSSALELVVLRFSTADRRMDLSMVYLSFAVIAVCRHLFTWKIRSRGARNTFLPGRHEARVSAALPRRRIATIILRRPD